MIYPDNPILALIAIVLNLYWYVVIAAVIMSWLTAFNVINQHNNLARSVIRALYALTEPVFRPIRRILPVFGGLDLSPLVVLVLLSWIIYSVLPWVDRRLGML
ncbi:MAG TPA: YggT family protein [Rhizomicrobium sp.]|nr:YggT family protein [Rhizomicrobium sp.]